MVETIEKQFSKTKLLNLIIIDSFSNIRKRQVVENLFTEKMICDLSESHNFQKFGLKRCKKEFRKN